jgi:hypothetical protein
MPSPKPDPDSVTDDIRPAISGPGQSGDFAGELTSHLGAVDRGGARRIAETFFTGDLDPDDETGELSAPVAAEKGTEGTKGTSLAERT